ncbi:hypothetical protein ATY89_08545 [Sulfolobus acidocaldarius]|nr:hypothetical protein SacN8_09370 [Sulfolobus acidocaldarius N8]AGE74105.1 hypothetical protein SacRon12I_09390 [Sulfolobus acidocaldarius Ron12/I]ALU30629.1 hypothetical protein ATY89_08545 [Sulfolobus acidocaldarius]WCM36073.1 hypothetical protein GO597_10400 [Sulfolobus acidocaldarius DSM 639]
MLFLLLMLIPTYTNSLMVQLSYPNSVYLGQNIEIKFSVLETKINSINFPNISTGVKLIKNGNLLTYQGFVANYILFPVNFSISNEMIVSFVGICNLSRISGIVFYGQNFTPPLPDYKSNTSILTVALNGYLWQNMNNSWDLIGPIPGPSGNYIGDTLIINKPVNYTVVLTDDNGKAELSRVFINGSEYYVGIKTNFPWNITYVGFRLDNATVRPLEFSVIAPFSDEPYVVFVNNHQYYSGYTDNYGNGKFTLTVNSTSMTVNITFPKLKTFKVINVYGESPPQGSVGIKVEYPVEPMLIFGLAIAITAVAFTLDIIYRRKGK